MKIAIGWSRVTKRFPRPPPNTLFRKNSSGGGRGCFHDIYDGRRSQEKNKKHTTRGVGQVSKLRGKHALYGKGVL